VHELIPWRTLTGRQQLYLDHAWMRDFGEGFVTYRPPVDLKSLAAVAGKRPNGHPEIALNFITPHQKWGIHSTYTENLIMLTLSRGGPIVWVSEIDAQRAGIVDNDWIELFNANGALTARAVVSQRVQQGMVLMYHAQEKIVNTPGSEITGLRGGIHNSVTRVVMKPTHMIGGYAQFAYGFNYYGTVGSNRDQFVLLRKMDAIDWIDEPAGAQRAARGAEPAPGGAPGAGRAPPLAQGAGRASAATPARSPARTSGRAAKARNTPGTTTSRPSPASATRRTGRTRTAGKAAGCAGPTARSCRGRAASGRC